MATRTTTTTASSLRPLRALMVEDNSLDAELIERELRSAGYLIQRDVVCDPLGFAQRLRDHTYDVILCDYNLSGWTGLDALAELKLCGVATPFILVSGSLGEERAVECIKLGATDYVLKDRLARLPVAVRRALETKEQEEQQNRTAQELWSSEAKLGMFLDQLPAIIWTTDAELRIVSLAGAGLAHLNLERGSRTAQTLYDLEKTTGPNSTVISGHLRALRGESAEYEIRFGERNFSGRAEPLRDLEGKVIGARGLALDVTEAKRAEAALQESKLRMEALIESAPVAIVAVDRDGKVSLWNPGAERVFGWKAGEVAGDPYPLIPPGGAEDFRAFFDVVLQGGSFAGVEVLRLRKDGSQVEVSVSAAPLRDASGEITGGMSVITDITARKQAEAEKRLLITAIEQSAECIMITDPAGIIQFANPAFTATTGYSREEAIGQSTRLLKSGKHDPDFYRQLWETILKGQTWRGEVINRRKDGSHFFAELAITPVRDARGETTSFIAIHKDITERRGLEHQLYQSQKQEAIGQLAGGIAHDFNNVLGAILGMAELGLMDAPEGSKIRDRLQKIQHHGGRAVALIRQLLAFSRRQVLERRDINLNHAVNEILSLLGDTLGKDIELHTKLAENLSATRADTAQVEQVLMNLCVNARDAMPKGGQLFIETRDEVIDEDYCRIHPLAHPGRYVLLVVSDTGNGMEPGVAEHIFEPFFTTKAQGKGTGLGLATVYGIVKQHEGFINVYSEPGEGATFKIYFPMAASAEADVPPDQPQEEVRGGSETILVAEDHEGLRELVSESLQSLGYTVLVAADGEEAVQQFEEHIDEVDLLVLDVVMPRMRGPEAYNRIHARRPDIPAIFCTGYSPDSPVVNGALQGGTTVLQKPYTTTNLARGIRSFLDRKRPA